MQPAGFARQRIQIRWFILPILIVLFGLEAIWAYNNPGNHTAETGFTPTFISPSPVLPTPRQRKPPTPTPEPLDCRFFDPDNLAHEQAFLPFEQGLLCIGSITGLTEEIFLVTRDTPQSTFLDIGYDAEENPQFASSSFDTNRLATYLSSDEPGRELYFIHNHPQFEGLPLAPPTFPDFLVLSTLKHTLREKGLDYEITGLVVNAGGSLWQYDTTQTLEEEIMIPLRELLSREGDVSAADQIYHIYLLNLYSWARIWKEHPGDPDQIVAGMREKGAQIQFYRTVGDFLELASPLSGSEKPILSPALRKSRIR